jgi:hypothetical protein
MRLLVAHWPASLREWLPGLAISLPLGLALWFVRDQPETLRVGLASVAVLLAVPWIVPAIMLIGVLSAPLYMWLHTQGPVPPVMTWLGAVIVLAALLGSHVNAALLICWWRSRRGVIPEPGLREFLDRQPRH